MRCVQVMAAKWSKVTLHKPIFAQLITEFPAFTKSATVITRCSQQPATHLYPGARQSNWHIHIQGVTGGTDLTSGGCSLC